MSQVNIIVQGSLDNINDFVKRAGLAAQIAGTDVIVMEVYPKNVIIPQPEDIGEECERENV